ncbi:hypothetical protein BDV40DRAFT_139026 [Aspergillus tamarii]|uniref:Uncharacterized protein n=1 Tax=Aspergillus tamarii TaxID=41984 RepID=A0A5N6UXW3_ASPTM|nr:hypothetical protein BDV40DRAFT_139026 [Aspergillus tamarii]
MRRAISVFLILVLKYRELFVIRKYRYHFSAHGFNVAYYTLHYNTGNKDCKPIFHRACSPIKTRSTEKHQAVVHRKSYIIKIGEFCHDVSQTKR